MTGPARIPKPPDANGSRVRCAKCRALAPSGVTNCPGCGVFLPRNEAGLKHGLRRYRDRGTLPEGLQTSIDEFRAQLVADQGGESELSALRLGLVNKLCDLEVGVRLLIAEVVKRGIDSRPGKAAWDKALRTIEAWHRLAVSLGLERKQRRVPTVEEFVAQRAAAGKRGR